MVGFGKTLVQQYNKARYFVSDEKQFFSIHLSDGIPVRNSLTYCNDVFESNITNLRIQQKKTARAPNGHFLGCTPNGHFLRCAPNGLFFKFHTNGSRPPNSPFLPTLSSLSTSTHVAVCLSSGTPRLRMTSVSTPLLFTCTAAHASDG